MSITISENQLEATHHVAAPPEAVFDRFTRGLWMWWPKDYTWSRQDLADIRIEPVVGGRCVEVGPHGHRVDWGRVLVCEAPSHIVFLWQINADRTPEPNPEKASEVALRLAAGAQGGTDATLVHRAFERMGESGSKYCAMMGSEYGWPLLMGRLAGSFE